MGCVTGVTVVVVVVAVAVVFVGVAECGYGGVIRVVVVVICQHC